jgi:hypothetical protein
LEVQTEGLEEGVGLRVGFTHRGVLVVDALYSIGDAELRKAGADGIIRISGKDSEQLYSATPGFIVSRVPIDSDETGLHLYALEPDVRVNGLVKSIPSWLPESELFVDLRFGAGSDRTVMRIVQRVREIVTDGSVRGGRFSVPLCTADSPEAVLIWRPEGLPPQVLRVTPVDRNNPWVEFDLTGELETDSSLFLEMRFQPEGPYGEGYVDLRRVGASTGQSFQSAFVRTENELVRTAVIRGLPPGTYQGSVNFDLFGRYDLERVEVEGRTRRTVDIPSGFHLHVQCTGLDLPLKGPWSLQLIMLDTEGRLTRTAYSQTGFFDLKSARPAQYTIYAIDHDRGMASNYIAAEVSNSDGSYSLDIRSLMKRVTVTCDAPEASGYTATVIDSRDLPIAAIDILPNASRYSVAIPVGNYQVAITCDDTEIGRQALRVDNDVSVELSLGANGVRRK